MQLVRLAGELGEKYGYEHEYYNLRTPADAIKLLCFNYPQLQKDLLEAHHNGIGYKVIQGGAAMGYDELNLPFGSRPLLVVPVISGSGGSTGQILAGVGLIAASFIIPGAGAFGVPGLFAGAAPAVGTAAATFASIGTAAGALGSALALGGVAGLISPQPEVPRLGSRRLEGGTNVRGTGPTGNTRGASGQQSYAFNGPVNTVGTGATIPVIYGRVITGGHLLALDVDIRDESDPIKKTLGIFSRDQIKINGEVISDSIAPAGELLTRKYETDKVFNNKRKDRQVVDQTISNPNGEGLNGLVEAESSLLKINNNKLEYDTDRLRNSRKTRQSVDVIFKVKRNFFDYVGDENSAKIDGFITYRINLRLKGAGDVIVSTAGATLQGKFEASEKNPFVYGHRLEVPRTALASHIKLEFEILDASVDNSTTFTVYGIGLKLLDSN
jgi:predicted phage tail protein